MADRREQLLAAFDADEEGEVVEDESNEGAADLVDTKLDKENDELLVEDKAGNEAADKSTDDKAAEADEKSVLKSGKKPKTGSISSKPVVSEGTKKVSQKADASKGTKDASGAKTLEEQERLVAEAGEAPKSWKIETREHWAKLPKDVRDQVKQRETEITQFIGQHGKAIQHKAQFDELVQPFMPFIAAQQSTPMKAFHSLMTTAARLTTGGPQQKAAVISEIMDNYGVDIPTLDAYLTAKRDRGGVGNGSLPNGVPNDGQPPAWARGLFEFMSEAKQAKQTREQRVQSEAAEELAAMEKKPFFSDLQSDIGLIMQHASSKGQIMTLDQAYAKARKMNPEVDKILTQREKAAAGNGSEAIAKARKAASTVRGAPGTGSAISTNGKGPQNEKPLTRRQQLSASFDEASEE